MNKILAVLVGIVFALSLTSPALASKSALPTMTVQHRHFAYAHTSGVGCTVLHDHRTIATYPNGTVIKGAWSWWRVTGTPYLSCAAYGAEHLNWHPYTIKR